MLTRDQAHRFSEAWVAAWNAHDIEKIMDHYAEDVELTSPVAAATFGYAAGKVTGKAAVREYFATALGRIPQLHFELEDVMWGISSIVLYYRNQRGSHTGEFMELSPDLKVRRVVANYSDPVI